jgi:hypothetical protein
MQEGGPRFPPYGGPTVSDPQIRCCFARRPRVRARAQPRVAVDDGARLSERIVGSANVAADVSITSADSFVAAVAEAAADRMTATGLRGEELRERIHLDPFTKDECERRNGVRPHARTLRTADFPGLGPVDLIVAQPRALIELKWAYQSPGKVFESLWDAIKLTLLGTTYSYRALYVGTGASRDEWAASESAALFVPGEIDPREFWARPLLPPRGPNYGRTIGEDLIIGARGNRPLRVHRRIAIRPVPHVMSPATTSYV